MAVYLHHSYKGYKPHSSNFRYFYLNSFKQIDTVFLENKTYNITANILWVSDNEKRMVYVESLKRTKHKYNQLFYHGII